jgi:ABC-type proline/glycine betaine transport system permease subunit
LPCPTSPAVPDEARTAGIHKKSLHVLSPPRQLQYARTSRHQFSALSVYCISALIVSFSNLFARIAQVSLNSVEPGLIEAARVMGYRRWHIVRHVLLPEALPSILNGMTVTAIAMIDTSAMAGAVGGGGLGDMAIRYGYERYETQVMVILILIVLVSIVQFAGEWLARRSDHKPLRVSDTRSV